MEPQSLYSLGLHAGNGTERHGSQTGSPHIKKEEPRLTGNGMPDTKFRGKRQMITKTTVILSYFAFYSMNINIYTK